MRGLLLALAVGLGSLLAGCASYEAQRERHKQEMAKLDKQIAERQTASKRFCALSPVARDDAIAAQWEREKHKPGSPWRSYGHMRVEAQSQWGC